MTDATAAVITNRTNRKANVEIDLFITTAILHVRMILSENRCPFPIRAGDKLFGIVR